MYAKNLLEVAELKSWGIAGAASFRHGTTPNPAYVGATQGPTSSLSSMLSEVVKLKIASSA